MYNYLYYCNCRFISNSIFNPLFTTVKLAQFPCSKFRKFVCTHTALKYFTTCHQWNNNTRPRSNSVEQYFKLVAWEKRTQFINFKKPFVCHVQTQRGSSIAFISEFDINANYTKLDLMAKFDGKFRAETWRLNNNPITLDWFGAKLASLSRARLMIRKPTQPNCLLAPYDTDNYF